MKIQKFMISNKRFKMFQRPVGERGPLNSRVKKRMKNPGEEENKIPFKITPNGSKSFKMSQSPFGEKRLVSHSSPALDPSTRKQRKSGRSNDAFQN